MKLSNCIVKFKAGKEYKTNWGTSQSAKVTMPDSSEIDIWGKPNSEICKWEKGETVQIYRENDTAKWKAVETEKPFPVTVAAAVADTKLEKQQTEMMCDMYAIRPPDTKIAQMLEYIDWTTKVYNHCLKMTMQNVDCDSLQPASVKDIATTMFIQTMKHFNV
jgi:hypothetical protein